MLAAVSHSVSFPISTLRQQKMCIFNATAAGEGKKYKIDVLLAFIDFSHFPPSTHQHRNFFLNESLWLDRNKKKYWGSFPQQSYKNFYHARGLKNVWRMREQEQWECTYGKIIKNEFPLKNFAFFTNLKFSVSLCRWDPIVKYWGADFVTILSAPRYPNDPL